ncbi:MAG: type II secretion system F family protein [Lachnospiraceae bacterium]|nr:type II secretion system F family protein [Lachnospiraceae bacterium]
MALNIIFLALSTIACLSFLILLLISGEFEEYIKPLDSKVFMLPEIYGVGFKVLKIFKFQYKTRGANKLRENMAILYSERYAEYYMRVLYAQKISIAYLIFAVGCAISALADGTDKIVMFVLVCVVCFAVYYTLGQAPADQLKKRGERFMDEFPNAVSTIALLVNSGMILREAWREVSMSHDSELYMEMRKMNEDIDNGVSEIDALYAFSNRCVVSDIKKFTSFIVQGLEKGSKDLASALRIQTNELWQMKKQNTLRRGELASSKLMIPLMVMFVGILIMVMGPIMTNLGI